MVLTASVASRPPRSRRASDAAPLLPPELVRARRVRRARARAQASCVSHSSLSLLVDDRGPASQKCPDCGRKVEEIQGTDFALSVALEHVLQPGGNRMALPTPLAHSRSNETRRRVRADRPRFCADATSTTRGTEADQGHKFDPGGPVTNLAGTRRDAGPRRRAVLAHRVGTLEIAWPVRLIRH